MTQPTTHGKRGRPPGTGKNDTDRLLKIAALMAAHPELKPTTAIKQIGETDPSIIRRLRDKYHEQQAQLMTVMAGDLGTPHETRHTMSADLATVQIQHRAAEAASQRAAPLLAPSQKKTAPMVFGIQPEAAIEIVQQQPAQSAAPAVMATNTTADDFAPVVQAAAAQDPFALFGKWFGNGIETAAVMFEHQMTFAQAMLKAAPVKAIWRQQIVATEYLLMLTGPGQRISQPGGKL
jgi:hypothetical protein